VEWARTLEPEEPIENVACTKPGCGNVYVIAAVNLWDAQPESPSSGRVLAIAKRAA
jgi:hypothetical protein